MLLKIYRTKGALEVKISVNELCTLLLGTPLGDTCSANSIDTVVLGGIYSHLKGFEKRAFQTDLHTAQDFPANCPCGAYSSDKTENARKQNSAQLDEEQ